jgi:hypothetical protein
MSKIKELWNKMNLAQKIGLGIALICASLLAYSIVDQIVHPGQAPLSMEQLFEGVDPAYRPDAGPQ